MIKPDLIKCHRERGNPREFLKIKPQTLLVGGGGHGDGDGVTAEQGHAFRAVCKQMGSRAALDVARTPPYLSDMLRAQCAMVVFLL